MPDEKDYPVEGFISASQEIDVNAIMASIRERIEEKKKSGILRQADIEEIADMELLPLPDFLEVPNVYLPHLYPGQAGDEFHPVHIPPEIEAGAIKKIMASFRKLLSPLSRFMLRPFFLEQRNLFLGLHNQNREDIHKLKQYVPVIAQSKEYIKLMHNALNNMIVEASKLKIEEEMLKTRVKLLEDRLEFLENRERAIEKKVFGA